MEVSLLRKGNQMKQTKGFITEDGTFFEDEFEGNLYEAELHLRHALAERFPQLPQEKFFVVVLGVIREMKEYLNAHTESLANSVSEQVDTSASEIGAEDEVSSPPPVDEHPAYLSGTEEDLASVLKLPTRRPSHVPDVGSGTQPEEVPNRSAVDGA